jgi:hypothetical protein
MSSAQLTIAQLTIAQLTIHFPSGPYVGTLKLLIAALSDLASYRDCVVSSE